jgi:MFS transporter, MHS family, citrate/tricarballylate:H+ symporter
MSIEAQAAPATGKVTKRQIGAIVAGNALEYYDFTTYAFFAVQIGHAFFPNKSAFVSLMLSLATFGAGFVMRPIGALVVGRIADGKGRKPALILSFVMMGLSILGLALTPTYAQIGFAAPLLALFWRLCQGFAMGADSGPTMAFLIEAAPEGRRGTFGAWMYISHGFATIAAGIVGVTVASLAGPAGLEAWGWRLAFLLGAAVLPLGLILRRSLPETFHAAPAAGAAKQRSWPGWRIVLVGLGMIGAQGVPAYLIKYMSTYANATLKMSELASLGATVAAGCSYVVAVVPAFLWMSQSRDLASLLVSVSLLTTLNFLSATPSIVTITESIRKEIRGTSGGTILAVGTAVFGATTQPAVAWFIEATGSPLAPAWYVIVFVVMGIVAPLFLMETAPRRK